MKIEQKDVIQERLHHIRVKAVLGQEVSQQERSFYFLYSNNVEAIKEFKQLEKGAKA